VVGDGPASVAAADLDGDGDLDLVCANSLSDTLSVLVPGRAADVHRGDAAGGRELSRVGSRRRPRRRRRLDLVCANSLSDTLSVLYQDAPRTFTAVTPLAVGVYPQLVAAADLDGDGDIDLVCSNTNSNTLSVLYGRSR
jgi:hypothetical protein